MHKFKKIPYCSEWAGDFQKDYLQLYGKISKGNVAKMIPFNVFLLKSYDAAAVKVHTCAVEKVFACCSSRLASRLPGLKLQPDKLPAVCPPAS